MATILLVDDNQEWLELLPSALVGHEVIVADSYQNALDCLEEFPYEVAIVDLNLLGSHDDQLGAELLTLLLNDYPTTRRIGLTGYSPSAVAKLFNQYRLDDLLLKARAKLDEMREVVKISVGLAYAEVPADVWAARAGLWKKVRSWKNGRLEHLDQSEAIRDQELHDAESAGRSGQEALHALAELRAMKDKLLADTKTFFKALSKARSHEGVNRMSEEFDRLADDFNG